MKNFFKKIQGLFKKTKKKRAVKQKKLLPLAPIILEFKPYGPPTSVPIFSFSWVGPEAKKAEYGIQNTEHRIPKIRGTEVGQWEARHDEFWAFLDSFLKEQNSDHTRRAYAKDLKDFLEFLKVTAAPMNVHTLVEYRRTLELDESERTGAPLSRVSINRKLATIKSFLNWLVLNGVLPNNPARAIKSFRAGRESPTRDIPDDLVRRILEIPSKHTRSGHLHLAILMVLFRLGLRRAEVISLRTSDIFKMDETPVMRVKGKGDKDRILPLPQDVFESINKYLSITKKDIHVDQVLFTPVKNPRLKNIEKNLNPNTLVYIVKRYAKLAGVTYRVSPHSARATAVSNALDHQAPHRAVQHMAGWSSPLMVTRYDKRKSDLKNSAVKYIQYET